MSTQKAKQIFLAVLDLPQAERSAYLDDACQQDNDLRRRVEALLAADDDPDSRLDRPAAEVSLAETSAGPVACRKAPAR